MRASSIRAAALAVLATSGFALMQTPTVASSTTTASKPGAQSKSADTGKQSPSDTKVHRLNHGWLRRNNAPRGKRYSASVRQHQRHAAKARRRRAAR